MQTFKDRNRIFYISSRGHNGTTWLSRSLSLHPDIVCWHGTRSIPPHPANTNTKKLSTIEFSQGLSLCNFASQNTKFFGAVHGYYGIDMKKPIENENGTFLYLIRNPLAAVNSNFVLKMKQSFPEIKSQDDLESFMRKQKLDKIYFRCNYDLEEVKQIKSNFSKIDLETLSGKGVLSNLVTQLNISLEKDLNQTQVGIIKEFMLSVAEITYYDYLNISAAGLKSMIRFEQMVSSKEYFRENVILKINNSVECSNTYLNQVFHQKAINQHSGKSYNSEQIRKSWLPFQNDLFDTIIFDGIFPIANAYSEAKYDIIPHLSKPHKNSDVAQR